DKYTDIALGTLMNMGALCDDLDKIDEALERYTRALRIADSLQLPMRSATVLRNMGVIFIQTGENHKALNCLFKSLYIRDSLGLKREYASTLNIIGKVYELEGNLQRANEMYIESLRISEAYDDKDRIAVGLRLIGENLLLSNDFASAEAYARKSLEIAQRASLLLHTKENYKLLTLIFAASHQLDSAKEYIDRYAELKEQMTIEFDDETPTDLSEVSRDAPDGSAGLFQNTPSNGMTWLFSLIIITGLVVFIFVLMALLTCRRQQRKKFYRKIQ
ncbi:MAG: tetratricopeptide repeat protein, partial [Bacteroidales bacterium]|nr:tetratricopeptide repeat protein [Bacteroidales bacterium]